MPMDEDGKLSTGGKVIPELLEKVEECSRNRGGELSIANVWVKNSLTPVFTQYSGSVADKLMTLYMHQAIRLREFLEPIIGEARNLNCMVTGGGAMNPVLMKILEQELGKIGVALVDTDPQMIDFKESLLIAWMAYLHATKTPLGACVWTGSSRDDIAGTSYGL